MLSNIQKFPLKDNTADYFWKRPCQNDGDIDDFIFEEDPYEPSEK